MSKRRTRVAVVVELNFDSELKEFARSRNVWLIETPRNRALVEEFWRSPKRDLSESVTVFQVDLSGSPEMWVADVLSSIDEHHGLREEWVSDVELEVRGVGATERIREELLEFGEFIIEEQIRGFVARRTTAV
jgi:hypothetical protein